MYADVIFRNKNKYADIPFTYRVEDSLKESLKIGHRVMVPFGISNKPLEAFVINIKDTVGKDISNSRIKSIYSILDEEPMLRKSDVELIKWIRKRYISKYGDAISLFYPKGYTSNSYKYIRLRREYYDRYKKSYDSEDDFYEGLSKKEIDFIKMIMNREIKLDELADMFPKSMISKMVKSGIAEEFWKYEDKENKRVEKIISLSEYPSGHLGYKQKELLNMLSLNEQVSYSDVVKFMGISPATISSLSKKGAINIEERDVYRRDKLKFKVKKKQIELNEEQKNAVEIISSDLYKEKKSPYLIHGVTGSGKTEVYLEIIEKWIEIGKSCVFLVPEIALTMQTISRVRNRFGDDVAVYHSQLSDGEKHDVYNLVKSGEIKIVIGTRSSIFLPMKNLGLVIIDECHDMSYRSDMSPKYDTLEVVRYMNYKSGITMVMGSATPSVSDYYKANMGEYRLIKLEKRANNLLMPKMVLVDMSKEVGTKRNYELSETLINEMDNTLKKGKQIILFLNRRGYAQFLTCKGCGHTFKCDRCDITLTYHKYVGKNICHYCGKEEKVPDICPHCGGKDIQILGVGTQKIEEIVKDIFPNSRILRIDKDTTSRKGDLDRILSDFNEKKADILIGTQILSKGHDFEDVALVGILSADMMLNFPDFKAYESTYQLITQVAGRAGRSNDDSLVVVQSYDTTAYPIVNAMDYDYLSFYNNEIKIRKAFGYEPFNNIIRLVFTGENQLEVVENSNRFVKTLKYMLENEGIESTKGILGPSECSISKINNKYRWQVIIKNMNIDNQKLKSIIKFIAITKFDEIFTKNVAINIDINSNVFI